MERELDRIARRSHGVVTRKELVRAGITPEAIKQRLRRGTLIRVHCGVYRVGHSAPALEVRYMAAVRACGPGSALSGLAAGHLLSLLRRAPPVPEVTTTRRPRAHGIRISRTRRLDPRDVTTWARIPVTTVPRTLVDLAGCLDEDDLARAYHEADVRYRTTPAQVEAVLARRPRSRGAGALRRVLHGETPVSLSRLESRFVGRLRAAGLPLPVTNRPAGAKRVDCRWPERALTVELDSYRYHRSRYAWEQDRRREREAYARGDQLRRYTWRDVVERPERMLAELEALLR